MSPAKSAPPYDVAVAGAGPAGIMVAIRAALKKKTVLIERNAAIGKKILLTGKGRCNATNTAPLETFIERFGRGGLFLRQAFMEFSSTDLVDFFESRGLKMKTERQGRVFPRTDRAASVVEVLEGSLRGVEIFYNTRLKDIKKEGALFRLELDGGRIVFSKSVILATGGVSYRATGSTGDGHYIAKRFGHTITPLTPALIPLKTKEAWVKGLQGLSLRNVKITFKAGKKRLVSGVGELVFTHFGVSGPLVLDLSGEVVSILKKEGAVRLYIDLKPGLDHQQLEKRLIDEFNTGKGHLKNIMKALLPNRLIPVIIDIIKVDPNKEGNQVTKAERRVIADILKALPLTISGSLPVEEAMVTKGGVATKEIDPRTMASKIVPGLYFAGEIIDGCAPSGGFNLQQALSTGYLAGEAAANA